LPLFLKSISSFKKKELKDIQEPLLITEKMKLCETVFILNNLSPISLNIYLGCSNMILIEFSKGTLKLKPIV